MFVLAAMMKKHLYILLILGFSISVCTQNKQPKFEKQLVDYFQKQSWDEKTITRDSLYTSPFQEKFNVSVSKNFIEFDTTHFVAKNPYFAEKYEEAEDYVKNFPKSFSVIYENSLISLFENGKFACFKLDSFERDTKLENKLNTKKFKYHWIIDKQLGALSGNLIYKWNGNKWIKHKDYFPLKNQPKLFEDDEFIVFGDCHGEWGEQFISTKKNLQKHFLPNLLVLIRSLKTKMDIMYWLIWDTVVVRLKLKL